MRFFHRIIDNRNPDSLSAQLRSKRFSLFKQLLATIHEKPINVFDVGGTVSFWQTIGLSDLPEIKLTLLNISEDGNYTNNIVSIIGDAKNMHQFSDKQFDMVFSNSVIEHVGDYLNQKKMASEIQRVGKRYFIQTPNYYFPIEPHFLFPFFHFLPLTIRIMLLRNFNLGWVKKIRNPELARKQVESICLLTQKELKEIFPGCMIKEEKILGLTKSLIIFN